MSRAFSYNDSISYTKPIQEEKNLKMKKYQKEKITKITTHSSYVTKYSQDLMKYFYIKIFYLITSSLVRSIMNETYTNYLNKLITKTGIDKKIKIKLGTIDETD